MTRKGFSQSQNINFVNYVRRLWNGERINLFQGWIMFGIVLTAISIPIGLYLDSLGKYGFWVNVFATLATISVSFVIGLFFLNDYNQNKWAKVRRISYWSLLTNLYDMIVMLYGALSISEKSIAKHYPLLLMVDHGVPYKLIVEAFDKFIGEVSETYMLFEKEERYETTFKYLKAIGYDLDQINSLKSQIIQSSTSQKVIDTLITLTDTSMKFERVFKEGNYGNNPSVLVNEILTNVKNLYIELVKDMEFTL